MLRNSQSSCSPSGSARTTTRDECALYVPHLFPLTSRYFLSHPRRISLIHHIAPPSPHTHARNLVAIAFRRNVRRREGAIFPISVIQAHDETRMGHGASGRRNALRECPDEAQDIWSEGVCASARLESGCESSPLCPLQIRSDQ